jgi:hypothetical protein
MPECSPPLRTYCTYFTTCSKFFRPPPPQWRNSPSWARASSLSWLHDHTQTHHTSVRLLWTSDWPDAKTSTWQHTTFTKDIHAPGRIRTHNPSKRKAADPCLRPRSHWDRPKFLNTVRIHTWLVSQYWYVSLLGWTINSVYVQNRYLKGYK